MRILVTGTGGFLAPHIARRLVSDGHSVASFDLKVTELPGVRAIAGDLCDAASVSAAMEGQEAVCHIGGVGDIYVAEKDPALAASANVVGTANVVAAARRNKTKVVFASTWEVYGAPVYQPLDENHPCSPQHPYSITKLAAERLALAGGKQEGVPVIALRLATCFGRGLRPNSVFRIFIDRAKRGEALQIHGDGLQTRQFVHANDVAAAFSLACTANVLDQVLNIASPQLVTIRQLAEFVAARYDVKVQFGSSRALDVPPARIDIRKAEEVLGWRPNVSFEEGMFDLCAASDN